MRKDIDIYGKILKEFRGSGKLFFPDGSEYKGDFELVQLSDGKILGKFLHSHSSSIYDKSKKESPSMTLYKYKLFGEVETGGNIKGIIYITGAQGENLEISGYKLNVDFEKPVSKIWKIHYGLTNFEFNGCDISVYPNGTHTRDRFTIDIKSLKVTFKHLSNYEEIIKEIKGLKGIDVTSEAIVEPITEHNIETISHIIYDLCLLLSLARGSYINWIYRDSYSSSGKIATSYLRDSYTRPFRNFDPLINARVHPEDTKYFLEKCYKNYVRDKENLGLNIAIEYYVESKYPILLEPKYITAFLCLEVLNGRYFKNDERRIVTRKEFMKIKKEIKYLLALFPLTEEQENMLKEKILGLNRVPLKRSLMKMFQDLDISILEKEIQHLIDIRNKIVHGRTFKEVEFKYSDYRKLISLLDKTLLRIMDYDGYFLDCLNSYKRTKIKV